MSGQNSSSHSSSHSVQRTVLIVGVSPLRALELETMARKALSQAADVVSVTSAADGDQLLAEQAFDLLILKPTPNLLALADLARAKNPDVVVAWMDSAGAGVPFGKSLPEPVLYGDILELARRVTRADTT